MRIDNVVAAELVKLRGLPAAALTAAGTVLAGALIAAALAASAADHGVAPSAAAVIAGVMPFVQPGLVLLGILPASHEYAGSQIRTTLAAVPNRVVLVTGKTVAALLAVTLTASVSVGASLAAAAAIQNLLDTPVPGSSAEPRTIVGAVAYLALIAMLSHAVSVLLRHLIPALVGMLSLILIVSPLLASLTEHARWLPDRAGMQLYDPTGTVLTTIIGTLILCGWVSVVGAIVIVRFVRSDP